MVAYLRTKSVCAVVGLVVLTAVGGWLASAADAAPVLNVFKSDDMDGGSFLTGRYSEGFSAAPDIGNGAHAGSWDGSNLYTDWELQGPLVATSTVVQDDRDAGGNGVMVLFRTFDLNTLGATLTLGAGGPWDGGDGPYTVDLDYYVQTVTGMFLNNAMVFASSIESFTGDVLGHAGYRLVGQANGAFVGQDVDPTPGGLPVDFPSWIPAGTPVGSWGEVGLVRFQITPEPATLLLLAMGMGGLLGLRRKR